MEFQQGLYFPNTKVEEVSRHTTNDLHFCFQDSSYDISVNDLRKAVVSTTAEEDRPELAESLLHEPGTAARYYDVPDLKRIAKGNLRTEEKLKRVSINMRRSTLNLDM